MSVSAIIERRTCRLWS